MSLLSTVEAAPVAVSARAAKPSVPQRCRADEECVECQQARLQRAAATSAAPPDYLPPIVAVAGSPGRQLDSATLGLMEARFGHDFGRVRVHTDSTSGRAAQAVGARAYTVGRDIYFGPGRFDPAGSAGRRLLAHELAHTIQQGDAGGPAMLAGAIDAPDAPLEREAEAAAATALAGGGLPRIQSVNTTHRPQFDAGDKGDGPVEWKDRDGKRWNVTRDVPTAKPCTHRSWTESTPLARVFDFNADTGTIGFHYRYCKDVAELTGFGETSSKAFQDLRNTALGGATSADPAETLRTEAIRSRGKVELNISGKLHIEVGGGVKAGTSGVSGYDVEGTVIIKGKTGTLLITGGLTSEQAAALTSIDASAAVKVKIGTVTLEASLAHAERRLAGGATTETTTPGVGVSVPVRKGEVITFRLTLTTTPGRGVTGGGLTATYGADTVPSPPDVTCFMCDCPGPVPHYHCSPVVEPGPKEPVTPGVAQPRRLYFKWWSTEPENPAKHQTELKGIASSIATGYIARGIVGFASPEGKSAGTYESGRGPTNVLLSLRRAEAARTGLLTALADAGVAAVDLPAATAGGEILGFEDNKEIHDRDLIPQLREKLKKASPDQQLEYLGLGSGLSATDRDAVLKDVVDFVAGRHDGAKLALRARWETIFPSLRRVDVTLNPPTPKPEPSPPAKPATTDCPAKAIAEASKQMRQLPPGQLLPPVGGECKLEPGPSKD